MSKNDPGRMLLSVIMPAYNEETVIENAVREACSAVLAASAPSELIVVDDGSTDGTGPILDRLSAADRRIIVIHRRNAGHGQALLTGLDAARGDYVLLVDSDMQIPLESFRMFWPPPPGVDAMLGVRARRRDPPARLALSSLIRFCVRLLCGVRLRDANAPFKLIRRNVWMEARAFMPENTLAPSLFLAIFARRRRLATMEKEVPHRARAGGISSLRYARLLMFCIRAFRQMLAFNRRLSM